MCLYSLCSRLKINVPQPPQDPGAEWVVEEVQIRYQEDEPMSMGDDSLDSMIRGMGGVHIPVSF